MKKQTSKQAKKASKLAKAENLKKKQAQVKIVKPAKIEYKDKKFIPICFITDDNYVIPTATAIQSLLESKKTETCYDIYIISTSLSKNNIEKFNLFASTTVRINIIQGNLDKYANLHKNYKGSFCVATPSALLKFEIPNFLANYDKAIYLDGDILVKKDLSDLWNIDIKNLYVAAAYDTGRLYSKNEKFMIYPQYFNSGVMLLNLRLMREENISQKLYEAKKNSTDMSLMDQNIFNQVLKDKIKNIDIVYNYLTINLHRAVDKYDFQDINSLFNRKYDSLDDIEDKAYILHFSSKDKPWKYYNGEYSEFWYKYFQRTPYKDEKIERVWKNSTVLSEEELDKRNKELIVSLTSYPARIDTVNQTIITLLDQTLPADKVILWLAPEQFPNKEADLPQQLLDLTDKGLTIDWYHDIRSYKKLIPTLKKYPDAIIITADDDILYPSNWIQSLYGQYKINTNIIWAQRCHHIEFNSKRIAPYKKWKHQISVNTPEYSNFPTCGAGVLYPPHCFNKEVLREDIFMKYCQNADDIWFWGNLVLNNKKICTIPNNMKKLNLVEGSQETALWKSNVIENQNDIQLNNLIKKYPKMLKLLKKEQKQNQNKVTSYLLFPYYALQLQKLKKKYFDIFIKRLPSMLTEFRIDVKNIGRAINKVEISKTGEAKISQPAWATSASGISQVVSGETRKQKINIKAINSGKLTLNFRAQDKRDENKTRIPLWCDYKSIKIDGKKINDKTVQTWHDKPFKYEMPVKDGQEVELEIEQAYHKYTKAELKNLLLKLNANSNYVIQNIDKLTDAVYENIYPLASKSASDKQSSFKHFLYHKVKTDSYTKTYICGIRVKEKPANIYEFIDKRLATLSKNWEDKFAAVVNSGASNKKELLTKIASCQKELKATNNDLAAMSKENNLIKSNSLYMIKSLNDKIAEVKGAQAVSSEALQLIQEENTAEIIESINTVMQKQQSGIDNLLKNLKQYYVSRTKTDNYSLEFRTFADMADCIRKNLKKIPENVDLVVGIPRSGMIPAYIIALFMNKKCCSLDEFLSGSTGSNGCRKTNTSEVNNVLVVDDSVYNGREMSRTREKLAPFADKYHFTYATVYVKPDSEDKVDVWMERVSTPRVWQWNYLNHSVAREACFDMDGVLCVDPTPEENDDGKKYLEFIAKAKPLYIPTYEINTIVTSRLEKYRKPTEQWLKDHGVKYKQLIMLDLPTAEERRKLGCHAKFKAEIYKKLSDTVLFVESEPKQAQEIALLTGKTVICTANDEVY